MYLKFISLAIVGCFIGAAAFAQDPVKVEPTHYRLDFENEHVQVVYVHYGPHEKSALHDHPGGVVVYISAGHLRFTDQNGNVKEVYAKPGEARWFPPFKHKVENLADTPYNAVYIGMKEKAVVGESVEPSTRGADINQIVAEYMLSK